MVPVKMGMTEQEVIDYLTQYYGEETVKAMIKATKRNGMSAYGAFMIREATVIKEVDKPYNLLRLPGVIPPKRGEANA